MKETVGTETTAAVYLAGVMMIVEMMIVQQGYLMVQLDHNNYYYFQTKVARTQTQTISQSQ